MIRDSGLHGRSDAERSVCAAKVIVSEMQGNRSLQIRELLAECIGEPRESANVHPHREILPFYKRSRDVIGIGSSVDDLGYDLRESRWGVPRVGAIVLSVIPEQFHKLREVHAASKHALNRAIKVISVRRNLKMMICECPL